VDAWVLPCISHSKYLISLLSYKADLCPPADYHGDCSPTLCAIYDLYLCDLQVLRVWARILQAVPNSRLLLKNKPFACVAARQHFLNQVSLSCLINIEHIHIDIVHVFWSSVQYFDEC
jgi:hypothetical protein